MGRIGFKRWRNGDFSRANGEFSWTIQWSNAGTILEVWPNSEIPKVGGMVPWSHPCTFQTVGSLLVTSKSSGLTSIFFLQTGLKPNSLNSEAAVNFIEIEITNSLTCPPRQWQLLICCSLFKIRPSWYSLASTWDTNEATNGWSVFASNIKNHLNQNFSWTPICVSYQPFFIISLYFNSPSVLGESSLKSWNGPSALGTKMPLPPTWFSPSAWAYTSAVVAWLQNKQRCFRIATHFRIDRLEKTHSNGKFGDGLLVCYINCFTSVTLGYITHWMANFSRFRRGEKPSGGHVAYWNIEQCPMSSSGMVWWRKSNLQMDHSRHISQL